MVLLERTKSCCVKTPSFKPATTLADCSGRVGKCRNASVQVSQSMKAVTAAKGAVTKNDIRFQLNQ